ncbi:MAG: beta-ketoacyl-ACP synthase II [Bacillota bacterium]|jgi:3-oxoacyl-[acyl-carrier-protein] synthase II
MRRVVISGLGSICPIGNDVQTMWKNLLAGTCGIDYITRFDTSDYKVKIAAEVKGFDPTLYMEKSDVKRTDLYAQYAIAAAAQAMTDSNLEGNIDPLRLGVYIGSGVGGMNAFIDNQTKLLERGPSRVSPFFITMMIGNMAAGLVAMKYQAQGPCLPIVTACSTGAHSIGEAVRAIKHGYADAIIAGGAEATVTPLAIAGFTNCMALCTNNDPQNSSIPFDKRRSGFVMGEGAGAMVLEEYEHAKARGADIYAEITGYGNTCDAHHITAPHPEAVGAANAIKRAMDEAGLTGKEQIYINAHGTSTPLNDKTETLAFKQALGEKEAYQAVISSTKSMTGHMLGAAGVVESIVAVLALSEGIIPPTIGYKEPDPECDLDYCPNEARKWQADAALCTLLGFGGHNACLAFSKTD